MSARGRSLVAQIDEMVVPPGLLAIWALGQSGLHNDMFALNHANPAVLADFLDRHYPRQRYHWLQPGELYVYVKGPRGSPDRP